MTILVTGGAGYIASHVVHELVDQGRPVIVVDNLSTGFRNAVPAAVPLFAVDCGNEELMRRLMIKYQVDAVLHFAASTVVPQSIADPVSYYRNNTAQSLELVSAAVGVGIKHFIFSSTAAVYGNVNVQSVGEDTPCRPMSPYGASKLMAETILHDVASVSNMTCVALRYFNVAGADPKLRTGQSTRHASHLIKLAVQAALGVRKSLDIYGTDYPTRDGTCIRDYVHVSDLAAAHVQALDYLRSGGASVTLNCGYGRGYTVREVVEAVKRVSGVDFTLSERERRPGDPACIVAEARAIRRLLSWAPVFDDLEAIVSHALAWEKKLLSGYMSSHLPGGES